jgi:hypothetical protein
VAHPVLSAVTSTRLFGHRSPGDRDDHLEGGQQVELHKRRTQLLQQPRPRGIRRSVPGPAASCTCAAPGLAGKELRRLEADEDRIVVWRDVLAATNAASPSKSSKMWESAKSQFPTKSSISAVGLRSLLSSQFVSRKAAVTR